MDQPPEDKTPLGLPQEDLLKGLEDGLNRLETELTDWQQFTAPPEKDWQAFDLTPTLNRAWRLAALGLSTQASLMSEVKTLPPVMGSPGLLGQAVLLLLDYAAGVLPPDGRLTFKAFPVPTGEIHITVAISGPSLSPKDCQELLLPPRGDRDLKGSLGPALAAAIAQWHEGELTAQPGDPEGLLFTLKLPPCPLDHENSPPLS